MFKFGHLGKPHDKHGGNGLEEVYCENSEMSSGSLCFNHGKTHTLFTMAIARENRYILFNDTLNCCDYTVSMVEELSMNTGGMILTRQN